MESIIEEFRQHLKKAGDKFYGSISFEVKFQNGKVTHKELWTKETRVEPKKA